MRKFAILLLLVLLVVGCSQQTEQTTQPKETETKAETTEETAPKVGSQRGNLAPDFELETLNGDKIKLSDLKGKPVHLVFWSVDCVYCMQELPHVEKVYNEKKDDYHVLALNITLQDGMDRFKKTVEDKGFTFPNLALTDENKGLEVLQNYGVRGIPHNVFIDKDGVIVQVTPGMVDEANQQKIIKELIAK